MPSRTSPTRRRAWNASLVRATSSAPTLTLADVAARAGAQVYVYHFTHVPSGVAGLLGATHVVEIPYVFGSFNVLYAPLARSRRADLRGDAGVSLYFAHHGVSDGRQRAGLSTSQARKQFLELSAPLSRPLRPSRTDGAVKWVSPPSTLIRSFWRSSDGERLCFDETS